MTANAAFIWWNPSAWWSSVMTPLGAGGAPLVSEGIGLAVLPQMTAVSVSPVSWTVLIVVTFVAMVAAYWHFFEYKYVRWTAWVAPMALWVIHSRSLTNYFTWSAVIAVVVIVASVGALRGQEVSRPCTE
jgi:predicted ferric reductase